MIFSIEILPFIMIKFKCSQIFVKAILKKDYKNKSKINNMQLLQMNFQIIKRSFLELYVKSGIMTKI